MSAKRKKIKEEQLQVFKYSKAISGMLESLHKAGCQRDKAGNRQLHMDQYMSLLLLYMFNPICTSLRAVQQASELKKVQRNLGCPRASLGSLLELPPAFHTDGGVGLPFIIHFAYCCPDKWGCVSKCVTRGYRWPSFVVRLSFGRDHKSFI